ncbi:gliding motility-associated C-terminal domain-containing protein [Ferruginibacter sp. SUN002]|uniref:T9SS type B sorting domain-containing protein n=1 Tax=Ferruginibacter sp. SUN002 TaxID=2937789 RepID=UPI003D3600C0
MKKYIAISIMCISAMVSHAQIDTAFWFAAPDASSAYGYDRPIFLRITSYQQPCNVTVSQPAGGGLPTQTFYMAANTTQSIDLTTWINSIECAPGNIVQNKGIKVTSDNNIAVYYEVSVGGPNPEFFAFKGKNGLGNEFYISSQNIMGNSPVISPTPTSSFNIVATEDNTSVTITPTNNIVGHLANIPFTITLNQGQTFAAIATGQSASQHLQGSYVTSTKPIAITVADDLLQGTPYGGPCEDLAGDQIIPVNIIGSEYIAVKSDLNPPYDKLYITATQNATSIKQDGVIVATINKGQTKELTVSNASTYVETSAPAYAYHLSGLGCEAGSALLPKINCTGSSSVSVTRSTNGSLVFTLLIKNGGQNSFLVNGVGGIITGANFSVVPATGGAWYAGKVTLSASTYPKGSVVTISNTSSIFQLGMFQGDNLGVGVGYFSDYNTLKAHAFTTTPVVCPGNSINLSADLIASSTYAWTGPNGYTSNVQNPIINNVSVLNSGKYHLTVTVPDCGTYKDSIVVTVLTTCTQPCTNWLNTTSGNAYATAGDLDVTGDKLTVEVNFMAPATTNSGGFLVSKHTNAADDNYAIWPGGCALNAANTGEVFALENCAIELNKTYHVAMVYDGSSLKFYRNGFLHSQTPASGNLINNNLLTHIARNPSGTLYPFSGYINEVRVWNVARTQNQIKTYMNSILPSPTTQTGLLGYYTFDNLLNKQGNTAYNLTLQGNASINVTNPNCSFVADSCKVTIPTPNLIVNDYTPVISLDLSCENKIRVQNAATYKVGDTVLMIQMKGAVIDSSNSANFGNITDYKNSGNYEFNYIKSISGNIIELLNKLTRQYDIPNGKVQLVRVPYFKSTNLNATLTCLPWDGSVGGVLVLNAKDTVNLNGNIDVTGKGFRGGSTTNIVPVTLSCFYNNYYESYNTATAAQKGEGIAEVSSGRLNGKGNLANGGGGGNGHNSGGGGGSNVAAGGLGGYQLDNCGSSPFDNRGIGGKPLTYSNAANKIFMGGGGGAGHNDKSDVNYLNSSGGNGGGIVIINSNYLKTNGFKIIAAGANAEDCNTLGIPCGHDAMGGGGGGGSVLLDVKNFIDNHTENVNGGKGADLAIYFPAAGKVGPGGGGGAGITWFSKSSLPPNATVQNTGGKNGVILPDANNPYGTTAGANGSTLFNLVLPIDIIPFKSAIDSVRISTTPTACTAFDFKGLSYPASNPITQWQWKFSDGQTGNTQNISHAFLTQNNNTAKLIVTDNNGCKDSTVTAALVGNITPDAGKDSIICSNVTATVNLKGTGGNTYKWTPANLLDNDNSPTPIATITNTTKFYVTVTNAAGCSGTDSITLTINSLPTVKTNNDTTLCFGKPAQLKTTGAVNYKWSPDYKLSNLNIDNPIATPDIPTQYIVTGTAANGCKANDTVNINVQTKPNIQLTKDSTICKNTSIQLTASGASSYQWTPTASLINPNTFNPTAQPANNTTYYLTTTDNYNCSYLDSVKISVKQIPNFSISPDKNICSNNQQIQLSASGGDSYTWSPAALVSNPNISNPIAVNTTTTTFTVNIKEAKCNYQTNLSTTVQISPEINVSVSKSNDIDCFNRSAKLIATGADEYSWSPSIGLDDPNSSSPTATLLSTQQYTLTGSTANGCVGYATVTVNTNFNKLANYYIPNAFTPNDDGLNDCFIIPYLGGISAFHIAIYNRWGNLVFESTNPTVCWDGMYKNQKADVGNYVYHVNISSDCGNFVKKGNLMLIR